MADLPSMMRRRSPAASSLARSGLRLISVSDIEFHLVDHTHALSGAQCPLLAIRFGPHHVVTDAAAVRPVWISVSYDFLIRDFGALPLERFRVDENLHPAVRCSRAMKVVVFVEVDVSAVPRHRGVFSIALNLLEQHPFGLNIR